MFQTNLRAVRVAKRPAKSSDVNEKEKERERERERERTRELARVGWHANDRLRGLDRTPWPLSDRSVVRQNRLQCCCTKWSPSAWSNSEDARHLSVAPCCWRIRTEDWGVSFRTPNNISLIHHKVRNSSSSTFVRWPRREKSKRDEATIFSLDFSFSYPVETTSEIYRDFSPSRSSYFLPF